MNKIERNQSVTEKKINSIAVITNRLAARRRPTHIQTHLVFSYAHVNDKKPKEPEFGPTQ